MSAGPIVDFRSAKENTFAERKSTMACYPRNASSEPCRFFGVVWNRIGRSHERGGRPRHRVGAKLGLHPSCVPAEFVAQLPRARPLLSPPCEGEVRGGARIGLHRS